MDGGYGFGRMRSYVLHSVRCAMDDDDDDRFIESFASMYVCVYVPSLMNNRTYLSTGDGLLL